MKVKFKDEDGVWSIKVKYSASNKDTLALTRQFTHGTSFYLRRGALYSQYIEVESNTETETNKNEQTITRSSNRGLPSFHNQRNLGLRQRRRQLRTEHFFKQPRKQR